MGDLELIAVTGTAPALLMLIYVLMKVRGPIGSLTIWVGLLAGMGCCLPAMGAEYVGAWLHHKLDLDPTTAKAVLFFGIVGPAEEGAKLVIILALAQWEGRRQSQRTLLAAVAVGIGFALLENLGYLARATTITGIAIARATTAVPAHGLFAMALGSLVVRAQIYPENRTSLIVTGFVLAAGLHGAYDFIVATQLGQGPAAIRLLQLGAVLAIGAFNRALKLAQAADEAAGDPWPDPLRALCFVFGIVVLVWPGMLLLASGLKPSLAGAFRVLAMFPLLIAMDLIRGAFTRARPTEGHRLALRI